MSQKVAFQAAIPGALFDDATDCLHRVVKPMVAAIREQLREGPGIPANVRISILVDAVPTEAELLPEDRASVTEAVRQALADGTLVDVH